MKPFCGRKTEILIFLILYRLLSSTWYSMSQSTSDGSVKTSDFCAFPTLHTLSHRYSQTIKHLQALLWLLLRRTMVNTVNYFLFMMQHESDPGAILRHISTWTKETVLVIWKFKIKGITVTFIHTTNMPTMRHTLH